MALETGTYISDLVVTNPLAGDGLGQADDHMRLIKSTLKNTFAGFTAVALSSSQAQLDAAVAAVVSGTSAGVFKAGTALLPGLTPVGDTNTGFYAPAADQIGIAANGAVVANFAAGGVTVTGGIALTGGVAAVGAYSGGTGQLVPVGSMLLWLEDTLPAEGGYCWANGGTLSRAANPLLWARWGAKYGAGDGSTTFNVKNMCETSPIGQTGMGGASPRSIFTTGALGTAVVGEANHVLTTAEMPSHNHNITDNGHQHQTGPGSPYRAANSAINVVTSGTNPVLVDGGIYLNLLSTSLNTTGITINNNGGGGSHNNVGPSSACNFIIRIG